MRGSKLEKLWEGTLPLGNLKVMDMSESKYLEVIPDLSKDINLEELCFSYCTSLVTLPSSIGNLTKLFTLDMKGCRAPENIPTLFNLESLEFFIVDNCDQLRNFPIIYVDYSEQMRSITVESCLWTSNLPGLVFLDCFMRFLPRQYGPEYFKSISLCDSNMEKLWEGVQSFVSLEKMNLQKCYNLKEIPDLSKATNLKTLKIDGCNSLLMLPSTIGNLQKLEKLYMLHCLELKVLPIDVNLLSLRELDFSGCFSLSMFPKISSSIEELNLNGTAIEGVPCFIENFSRLKILKMRGCKRLKNISPNIFRLKNLDKVDFADCGDVVTVLSDVSAVTTTEDHYSAINVGESYNFRRKAPSLRRGHAEVEYTNSNDECFKFENCFKLDEDARKVISRSCFKPTILPGGEVPTYFKYRAFGNSLTVTLPQSVFSQKILQCKARVVFEAPFEWPGGLYFNVHYLFNGISYEGYSYMYTMSSMEMDHLCLCFFEVQPEDLPSELEFIDIDFTFGSTEKIKGCGVQLFNGSDGSYETTYNQQSGGELDVVETGGSKKRMRMASETSRLLRFLYHGCFFI